MTLPAPPNNTAVRLIDPSGLTVPQLSGERCAYSNCQSLLTHPVLIGQTPDGTPLLVCDDH